jgi:autotransporter-associated beta strand protein
VVSAVNAGGTGNNSRAASATPLPFATADWTNLITGTAQSWNVNANWTNIAAYPNATGVVANMTAAITTTQTNNVNQNLTLGWLNLGAANGSSAYLINPNGGSLTFSNGTNNGAGLQELATSAGDTVAVPLILSNSLTVLNNSTHTLTLAGSISGANSLVCAGTGPVSLATNNSFSGSTVLNGAWLITGNSTASLNGFGGGSVNFYGGTLQFYGYGGSGGTDWGGCTNPLAVPPGQSGTLLLPPRFGYATPFTSALTGGGTFNVTVDYIRLFLTGNWSAFTGQINVSPRSGTGDFRINNTNGYAHAAIYLNNGVNFYNVNANGQTTYVGELGGASGAYVGNGNDQSSSPTWCIGARNTTNTFAGTIADSGGTALQKVGTGALILTGTNTYAGTTTISGGILQIGAGGNNGTLGAGNVTDNAALVYNCYNNTTCGNLISGTGSFTQAGNGVLLLTGANTFSGATFIMAGTLALTNTGSLGGSTNIDLVNDALLDVSGATAGLMTLGSGRTISGEGVVKGNFTLTGGATLAPGNNDLGELTFSNALTLNFGSRTILNVSHNSQTNNVVAVLGAFSWGGSLVISNADAPLQAGDTFTLFNGTAWAGSFSSLTLPALPPGLYWNTNAFKTSATLVVAAETPPTIVNIAVAGGNLTMSGTGGMNNGTYYVLTATNLAAPVANWTRLSTNQFDGNGNFNFTSPINHSSLPSFFLLRLP